VAYEKGLDASNVPLKRIRIKSFLVYRRRKSRRKWDFLILCKLFLRSIITAKHIHDLVLIIEEGFPHSADDAGETETFLIVKAVDYFALSAVRSEVS
jgi:hypothetical protein